MSVTKALILAPMYIKYCEKFRIKTDIAFADMCVKTAKLTKKAKMNKLLVVVLTKTIIKPKSKTLLAN